MTGEDDESLRTIQAVGLVETVLPHTTPHHIMRLVKSAGNVLLVSDPATTEFGWGRKHGFIQPEVDRALLNGLRRFDDVVVVYGHSVFEVAEDEESVTVTARGKSADGSTAERCVRARYLVGCDGGKSPTRKRLGIGFDGIRHRHDGWSSTLRGARVRLGEICATRRPNVAIDADSADRRPMRTGSKEGISS